MRVLLVIAATCIAAGAAKQYKHVSVKYSPGPNGYWSVPKRASDDLKFHFVAHEEELNVDLYSYPDDPRFFILYDHYGNIAGLRTGFIKDDLEKRSDKYGLTFPYKLDDKDVYESGTYWGKDIWYSTVLFVDPDVLKQGGRKDPKKVAVEDVYLKLGGKWTQIPTDQCEVEKLGFVKQGCFPGMGKHYFYKLSKDVECKDIPGVFLLFECGELVGMGLLTFGSFTKGPYRTWLEDPPASAIKIIVPHRPKCLTDWITKHGVSSLHIFFKAVPRLTSCLFPFQRLNQCSKTPISDIFRGRKPYSQSELANM